MYSGRLSTHKFGDLIAVSCVNDEGGYTVYVEPDAARIFAKNILINLDKVKPMTIKSRPVPGTYARCPICGSEILSESTVWRKHPTGARFDPAGGCTLIDTMLDQGFITDADTLDVQCSDGHNQDDWKTHFSTPVEFVEVPPKPPQSVEDDHDAETDF